MPLLDVRHLTKHFVRRHGLFRAPSVVKAVTGAQPRRPLELVGDVFFRNENVLTFSTSRLRQARRDMQIVFQDPYSSLNPRMRVGTIVEEPLVIHGIGNREERRARVEEAAGQSYQSLALDLLT